MRVLVPQPFDAMLQALLSWRRYYKPTLTLSGCKVRQDLCAAGLVCATRFMRSMTWNASGADNAT